MASPGSTVRPLKHAGWLLSPPASLHRRNDRPFTVAATYYYIVPGETPANLVISHVSCDFDSTGF